MLLRNLPSSNLGEILRDMFTEEQELSIPDLAAGLGVSRVSLSAIVSEGAGTAPF